MNRLFVISGPPASGKTTLAKGLADALSIPCFSRDEIKEVLFGSNISYDEYSYKLMYDLAKNNINHTSIIIESNFIPKFDQLKIEAITNNIQEIYCYAPLEVLKERFNVRDRHVSFGSMSDNVIEHQPIFPKHCMRLDTSKIARDNMVKKILEKGE